MVTIKCALPTVLVNYASEKEIEEPEQGVAQMNGSESVNAIINNLRIAMRTLAKTPGFTATVVLTLALGIGANSAVFSAINGVLLKPLPFPDGDRLMQLNQRSVRSANTFVAPPRLRDWDRTNST